MIRLYFQSTNIYLERRGGVQLLLGALDEDGAVREGEAHAPNLGITERLPAVSLVSDDFHRLQCRGKPLKKFSVKQIGTRRSIIGSGGLMRKS